MAACRSASRQTRYGGALLIWGPCGGSIAWLVPVLRSTVKDAASGARGPTMAAHSKSVSSYRMIRGSGLGA
jgi:hypothetical protein